LGASLVSEFLGLGEYAAYIGSAFGLTIVILGGLLLQSWHFARKRERELMAARAALRPRTAGASRPVVARRVSPDENGARRAGGA
jgi:heme exporter protein D